MRKRPHNWSVTSKRCGCGYLEERAAEPECPIEFNERASEYEFHYDEPGRPEAPATLIIYHCPFCGGAAPPSKRAQLFRVVPRAEEERLAELLDPIRSFNDALQRLGEPDFRSHSTTRTPEAPGRPSSVRRWEEWEYRELSEVANVRLIECSDGRVRWTLYGKPLPNKSST